MGLEDCRPLLRRARNDQELNFGMGVWDCFAFLRQAHNDGVHYQINGHCEDPPIGGDEAI